MPTHTRDADCTVDPTTGTCFACGALHGDPCPDCGGRGYHEPACTAGYRDTGRRLADVEQDRADAMQRDEALDAREWGRD
jgi:hypothetical protein